MVQTTEDLLSFVSPDVAQPREPLDCLQQFLRDNPLVKFIRLQWQDYTGILRLRIVVVAYFEALTASGKAVHIPPIGFHCIVDNTLVPWLDSTGSHLLVPDYSSLRLLPNRPQYAVIMCGILQTRPFKSLPSWDLCPRHALANVMRAAADKFAINILVGFEVEFEIMQRSTDGALVPLSTGLGRYAASGLRDPSFTLVEEAMGILLGSGVGIQTFQTEGRRGQYEISLSPKSPLSAIDEVVLVQDCLKQFFADHGYVLTMSPKPVAGRRQAVGLHTHLSIDPATQEESFLAGLLAELRMLCAFCLPQMLSYDRVQPYLGGEEVAWGTEDRKVPIRKIGPGHWELRCVDATANMYLALAGVLHAGLLGLEQKKALQWHDTALPRVKPFNEPSHLCRSSGIKGTAADKESGASDTSSTQELLPLTLEAALEYLEQQLDNEVADFNTMTQSDIIRHYLELKKYELSRVRQMEPQVMRELLIELF